MAEKPESITDHVWTFEFVPQHQKELQELFKVYAVAEMMHKAFKSRQVKLNGAFMEDNEPAPRELLLKISIKCKTLGMDPKLCKGFIGEMEQAHSELVSWPEDRFLNHIRHSCDQEEDGHIPEKAHKVFKVKAQLLKLEPQQVDQVWKDTGVQGAYQEAFDKLEKLFLDTYAEIVNATEKNLSNKGVL